MEKGLTCKGVPIQFYHVPNTVVDEQSIFYVCIGCGKCYWNGSHVKNVLIRGCLRDILHNSVIEK